jgi:hypothetical protein
MAMKSCVAIRFTTNVLEVRREGFVNETYRLILYHLKKNRSKEAGETFEMRWYRLPDEPLVYCVDVIGEHEPSEVRAVIAELALEAEKKELPVVLDMIRE